jgi:hypothetical protein
VRPFRSETGDTNAQRVAAAIVKSARNTIARAQPSSVKLVGKDEIATLSKARDNATLIAADQPALPRTGSAPEPVISFGGLFDPPDNGLYLFTLMGAPGGQLWISPNEEPAAKMPMLDIGEAGGAPEDTVFVGIKCYQHIRVYLEVRTGKTGKASVVVRGPGIANRNLRELLKNAK